MKGSFKPVVHNLRVLYKEQEKWLKKVNPRYYKLIDLAQDITEFCYPECEELKEGPIFLSYDVVHPNKIVKYKLILEDDIVHMFERSPLDITILVKYHGPLPTPLNNPFTSPGLFSRAKHVESGGDSNIQFECPNYNLRIEGEEEGMGNDVDDDLAGTKGDENDIDNAGNEGDDESDEIRYHPDTEYYEDMFESEEEEYIVQEEPVITQQVPAEDTVDENVEGQQVQDTTTSDSSLGCFVDIPTDELSDYESSDNCEWFNDSDEDLPDDPLRGWSSVKEVQIPENPNEQFNLKDKAVFASVSEFRATLQEYVIRAGIKIERVKNDKDRIIVKCADPKCPWRIHASLITEKTDKSSFVIKKCVPDHCCIRVDSIKEANAIWIAQKIVPILRTQPEIKNSALKAELEKLGVDPKYMQLYRAKRKAQEIIQGNPAKSYAIMSQYAEMVQRTNPGSTTRFQFHVDENGSIPREPNFKRFFLGFDALKQGFLGGCQPFIGLDGCHLKGRYGGILLSAVSLDGNMGLYPLAFAIVESENKDSWGFFLTCLTQMLGGFDDGKAWTFITDRQKGLVEAMSDVAPNVVHRKCCRHIYANLRLQHAGILVKKLFWAAARAYTRAEFNNAMNRLKDVKPAAYQYLIDMGDFSLWARHAFALDIKNDHITNNLSESFNAWLGDLRMQPVQKLLDGLRAKLMDRVETRYQRARRWTNRVCGRIVKILNLVKEEGAKCKVLVGGTNEFQVNDGIRHYIVDLRLRHCDCRFWDLSGIPCKHAARAISFKRQNIEDYVHDSYSVEVFLRVYKYKIKGIPDVSFWPEMEVHPMKILPPLIRRPPGRPKKHRRREVGEAPRIIPSRKREKVKCSTCGGWGHNKRSCSGVNKGGSQRNVIESSNTNVAQGELTQWGSQRTIGDVTTPTTSNVAVIPLRRGRGRPPRNNAGASESSSQVQTQGSAV